MDGMIEVREHKTVADMLAGYAAARARTRDIKPFRKPVVLEIAAPATPASIIRAWLVYQDAHITAWKLASFQEQIKSLEMSLRNREDVINRMVGGYDIPALPRISAQEVCRDALSRCAAAGLGNYSMYEILGPRRSRDIVQVRHECIAAVVVNCHHLSYPQIGRFFNRDHTSILHAARKMGAAR